MKGLVKYIGVFFLFVILSYAFALVQPIEKKTTAKDQSGQLYFIKRIDGCQYLKDEEQLTHKGDCDNPIHCHNK